jgi:hypothetical protein
MGLTQHGSTVTELGSAQLRADTLTPSETVGKLHEAIEEAFGSDGWSTLVKCWQDAAGIVLPNRITNQPKDYRPSSLESLPALPREPATTACLHEEGLHEALSTMPTQVAAFLLRPPAASRIETADQQALLESIGAWAGW